VINETAKAPSSQEIPEPDESEESVEQSEDAKDKPEEPVPSIAPGKALWDSWVDLTHPEVPGYLRGVQARRAAVCGELTGKNTLTNGQKLTQLVYACEWAERQGLSTAPRQLRRGWPRKQERRNLRSAS